MFECKKIVPSAGQGTIVIQSREDDDKLNSVLSKINHFETSIEAKLNSIDLAPSCTIEALATRKNQF